MGNLMFKNNEPATVSMNGDSASSSANINHNNDSHFEMDTNNPHESATNGTNGVPDGAAGGSVPESQQRDPTACYMIDLHSAQFLSPATDLAHLLLTSTTREYRKEHWDEVVQHYYDIFNTTLAEFGLVLRHLGTTYNDFLYEVKRALRGQFLCVAFIIPIGKF